MGEIAEYFKREKYISRRLSLVVLGGTVFLVPLVMASAHGRIAAHLLEGAIIAYVVFAAVAVVLIVQKAHVRFPKSRTSDDEPLDEVTRRRLRRRIWLLEFFVVFYALGLLNALIHTDKNSWLATAIGAGITLLIEIVLIKAIRRLNGKLKSAAA